MKRISTLLTLFILLCTIGVVWAGTSKTLTVTFAYNGSPGAGFRLYMDKSVIIDKDILLPSIRTGSKVIILNEGKHEFYMTAVNPDGTESSPSNTYFYEYLEADFSQSELVIKIKVE